MTLPHTGLSLSEGESRHFQRRLVQPKKSQPNSLALRQYRKDQFNNLPHLVPLEYLLSHLNMKTSCVLRNSPQLNEQASQEPSSLGTKALREKWLATLGVSAITSRTNCKQPTVLDVAHNPVIRPQSTYNRYAKENHMPYVGPFRRRNDSLNTRLESSWKLLQASLNDCRACPVFRSPSTAPQLQTCFTNTVLRERVATDQQPNDLPPADDEAEDSPLKARLDALYP